MNLAKASLPLMVAVSLAMAACNDPAGTAASPVLQAAGSKTPGSTTDPAPNGGCKESTDPNGVPCKICWDSSGSTYYDGCDSAGRAAGSGGAGGTGGATEVKCLPTTDPSTGAACKTCYAADGSYTSTCAPPPPRGCVDASGKNTCGSGGVTGGTGDPGGSGGTNGKCVQTTDPSGAVCNTCYAADGSVTYNDCSSGGTGGAGGSVGPDVKCVDTTDPSGADCKTCYAADGSITYNACSGGGTGGAGGSGGTGGSVGTGVKCVSGSDPTTGADCKTCYAADGSITANSCSAAGTGASCIGAPNMETGQICKVCSDVASGKVLFVDCGALSCGATSSSTPPTK
jgi:hypothetical protein